MPGNDMTYDRQRKHLYQSVYQGAVGSLSYDYAEKQ